MSFWDEIDEKEYLPFAKFRDHGKNVEIVIQLIDNEPSIFKNRWGKEQWSIRVYCFKQVPKGMPEILSSDDADDKYLLVGGVRLFRCIKQAKDFDGLLRIRRIGEGFKTQYKMIQKIELSK